MVCLEMDNLWKFQRLKEENNFFKNPPNLGNSNNFSSYAAYQNYWVFLIKGENIIYAVSSTEELMDTFTKLSFSFYFQTVRDMTTIC